MCKQSKWFCNCHVRIPKPEWWDNSVGMGYSLAPASENKQSGIPHSLCLVNVLFGSTKHKGSFRVHVTVQEVLWDHNSTWWLALFWPRCCTPREIGMQVCEFAKDTRHVQGMQDLLWIAMASLLRQPLKSKVFFKWSFLASSTRINLVTITSCNVLIPGCCSM
jgi:hypothetical protein